MRKLIIVNPLAGRGAGLRQWQRVSRLIIGHRHVDVAIPHSADQTRRLAAEAAQSGVERVVVVGGDGTLAAVAAELAYSPTILGAIPAGTGNDFCRNSGIPLRLESALHTALWAQPVQIDLGQAEGRRPFINAAGVGFDGHVAAKAATMPAILGGTLPYLIGAISTLTWFRPVHATVSVDGQRISGPTVLVVVANGQFYGGGMKVLPNARRDDGLLDVFVAGALRPLQILRLLSLVYSGRHTSHPLVRLLRGRAVQISVDSEVGAQLDGEVLTTRELRVSTLPGALSVAMPPDSLHIEDPWWAPHYQTRVGSPESALWHE